MYSGEDEDRCGLLGAVVVKTGGRKRKAGDREGAGDGDGEPAKKKKKRK